MPGDTLAGIRGNPPVVMNIENLIINYLAVEGTFQAFCSLNILGVTQLK